MLTPQQLPLYVRKTPKLRFPISRTETYKVLIMCENCRAEDIWDNLDIYPTDIKVFSSPRFKVAGIVKTGDKSVLKEMKTKGLMCYPYINTAEKLMRNMAVDMTQFMNVVREKTQSSFNSPRASMLFTSGLDSFAKNKEFHNTLLYVVDRRKPIEVAMNRRLIWIPLFHYFRAKERLPYVDDMILCVIDNEGHPTYRKIYDKNEAIGYNRIMSLMKSVKISDEALKKFGEEIASKMSLTPDRIGSIKTAAQNNLLVVTADKTQKAVKDAVAFVAMNHPEQANEILSVLRNNPENEEQDIKQKALILASMKYKVTNNREEFDKTMETSRNVLKQIKDPRTKGVIKAKAIKASKDYDSAIGNYVTRTSTDYKVNNLSTDPIQSKLDISAVLEGNVPGSIMENKQEAFNTTFFNDLIKMLKTFSTKKFPLILDSWTAEVKENKRDVRSSKIVSFKFKMRDKEGNEYPNEIIFPYIDKQGNMKINGLEKTMIGQLSLKPVYFPEPHLCKISTYFATCQIQYREVRKKSYVIIYTTGMVAPAYLVLVMLFKNGWDDLCKLMGFDKNDLVITKDTAATKNAMKESQWFIQFENNEYIFFPEKALRNNKVAQSIFHSMKLISYTNRHITSDQFLDPDYQGEILIMATGRKNAAHLMTSFFEGFLDPISTEMIQAQKYPTKLDALLWKCINEVHTDKADKRTDLGIQRYRSTETFLHLLYKQMLMAYRVYETKKMIGYTNAEFQLDPKFVYKNIVNTQLIRQNECINPIEELAYESTVTYVGVGGVSNADGVPGSMRTVNPTYYGVIDPIDTPEGGGNVGMLQHLTVGAQLQNNRGMFILPEHTNSLKTGTSSVSGVTTPLSNHDDGARLLMASNQVRQAVPLVNKEVPLVQSGYETALPAYLSDKFIKKSPVDGIIKDVADDHITVESTEKGSKGKKFTIDLNPKKLNSGLSVHSLSYFTPRVTIGEHVKKYHLLAEGSSVQDGTISMGSNLLVAFLPYNGSNHDDALIMRKGATEYVSSRHIETISLQLPSGTTILEAPGYINGKFHMEIAQKMMKIGDGIDYEIGDPIISYVPRNISEYLEVNPDERVYTGGIIKRKADKKGRVVNVRIYTNEDLNDYPTIKDLALLSAQKNKIEKGNSNFVIKGYKLEGLLIEIDYEYIESGTNIGDKYANRHGNKGVISLSDEEMPITPWGQKIDLIYNPLGVIGRMNVAQIFESYLGLIGWKVRQEILKSPTRKNAYAVIKKVYYDVLDKSKGKIISTTYLKVLKTMKDSEFQIWLENIKRQKGVPWIYPTYSSPSAKDILKGLDILGLKDKYTLKLPKYGPNVETQYPVMVGYMYMYKMEHVSSHKISSRSTGAYNTKSGQPSISATAKGGQRVGEFDSWSLLGNGATNIVTEMFGAMSDDHPGKNELISNIINNGYTHNSPEMNKTPTRDMLEVYFRMMMLDLH